MRRGAGETRDWVFPLLGNPRYRERSRSSARSI